MSEHRHRPKGPPMTSCYIHCVRPQRCNPRAHGGVVESDICRCGAVRIVALNTGEHEYGPWAKIRRD